MSEGKGAELVSVALNEVTHGLWNRYARFKFCVYNFLVFAPIASSAVHMLALCARVIPDMSGLFPRSYNNQIWNLLVPNALHFGDDSAIFK